MLFLCSAAELNLTVLSLIQSLAAGNAQRIFAKQNSSPPPATPFSSKDQSAPPNTAAQYPPASGYDKEQSQRVTTLNVLGMQPTFKHPPTDYTESDEADEDEEEEKEEDEEDDEDEEEREEEYSLSRDLTSLSVGTQGLIENETIPDLIGSGSDSSHTQLASPEDLSAYDSMEISGFKNISAAGLPSSLSLQTAGRQSVTTKRVTLGSVIDMREGIIEDEPASDVPSRSSVDSSFDRVGLLDDRFEMVRAMKKRAAKSVTLTLPPRNVDSRCTHYTHSTAPLSGGMGVMGSQVPPSTVYRQSLLSSNQTFSTNRTGLSSSMASDNSHRLNTWPAEISTAYTLAMASIVIYGRSSHIQKMALEGNSTDGYGLAQLSTYGCDEDLSSTG